MYCHGHFLLCCFGVLSPCRCSLRERENGRKWRCILMFDKEGYNCPKCGAWIRTTKARRGKCVPVVIGSGKRKHILLLSSKRKRGISHVTNPPNAEMINLGMCAE